jgi:hypothetical protein
LLIAAIAAKIAVIQRLTCDTQNPPSARARHGAWLLLDQRRRRKALARVKPGPTKLLKTASDDISLTADSRQSAPQHPSHYKKRLSYTAAFCFIWLMNPTIILLAISSAILP